MSFAPPLIAYLDSSAFVKLVVSEPESAALKLYLRDWPDRACSVVLRTEAVRAVRRAKPSAVQETQDAIAEITLVRLTDEILDAAALLDPVSVRSLDSIHLATARSLGNDVGVVVTYDERMAEAARALNFEVASPSEASDEDDDSGEG